MILVKGNDSGRSGGYQINAKLCVVQQCDPGVRKHEWIRKDHDPPVAVNSTHDDRLSIGLDVRDRFSGVCSVVACVYLRNRRWIGKRPAFSWRRFILGLIRL